MNGDKVVERDKMRCIWPVRAIRWMLLICPSMGLQN